MDESDLADLLPLRDALLTQGNHVTLIVDANGSITSRGRVPTHAHACKTVGEVLNILSTTPVGGVDAIVSSCPQGSVFTPQLVQALGKPCILLQDARRVRYGKMVRDERLRDTRIALLANDAAVATPGAVRRYITGLPRYDRFAQLTADDRADRSRKIRKLAEIPTGAFVVLFAGQMHEAANMLLYTATALRAIPPVSSDRPIPRVLALLRCPHMPDSELALWNDTLSQHSNLTPVRVIHDIAHEADGRRKDAIRLRAKSGASAAESFLMAADHSDAVLAADLVVGSSSSVLYTAIALRTKTICIWMPCFGQTAYQSEIANSSRQVPFPVEPTGCMRVVRDYTALRKAIVSAIPQRTPDNVMSYPSWPEQEVCTTADWTKGNNTLNCVAAIESFIDTCGAGH